VPPARSLSLDLQQLRELRDARGVRDEVRVRTSRDEGLEFWGTQCGRTDKLRRGRFPQHRRNAADVVVVPVCDDNQPDTPANIDPQPIEVVQGSGVAVGLVKARVNHHPIVAPEVNNQTLADPRTENGEFEFVLAGRIIPVVSLLPHSPPPR
jgi:hypothetical protein